MPSPTDGRNLTAATATPQLTATSTTGPPAASPDIEENKTA